MGTEVRLVVEGRARRGRRGRRARLAARGRPPPVALPARQRAVRAQRRSARRRSRRSPLLRAAVGAALWAAERTGGLVDPTLLGALRAAGYAESLAGRAPASLADALAAAPPRAPALAAPARAPGGGSSCATATTASTARRALGLDTGGTTKGLAADAVAHRLAARRASRSTAAATCASAATGRGAGRSRSRSSTRSPASAVDVLRVAAGGVATSGLGARLWARPDGGYAHHLLDPATGEPAWTGLISVTALAPTALEAETLAKAALLSGPDAARAVARAPTAASSSTTTATSRPSAPAGRGHGPGPRRCRRDDRAPSRWPTGGGWRAAPRASSRCCCWP